MKRKHRVLITGAILLVLIAMGVAGFYVFRPSLPAPQKPFNANDESIAALLKAGPPKSDPLQKALYYAQLAQYYERVSNYDAALTNYLQAQALIDSNKLNDQIVYYQALADIYSLKRDTANTKLYLNKQLIYLQQWQKQHPDDTSTVAAIKALQDRLKQL